MLFCVYNNNYNYGMMCFLSQVASSVKCLSMKELKNQLKKESCYTALLTTARIRGVEKVSVTNLETDANTAQVMYITVHDCVCANFPFLTMDRSMVIRKFNRSELAQKIHASRH